MSRKAVAAFLSKVEADPRLESRLRDQAARRGVGAVAELAAAIGFSFTAEELEGLLGRYAAPAGELSDEALEHVVGGINPQPEPPGSQDLFARLAHVRLWIGR